MGLFVIFFVLMIVANGYKTYQRQDYWLDRQLAKLVRWAKEQFARK